MKLTPEQELDYRIKMGERAGLPLDGYDSVVFGLGNELFVETQCDYLSQKDILDRWIDVGTNRIGTPVWLGVKDGKRILYFPLRFSAPVANAYFEPYLCHSTAKKGVGIGYVGSLQEDIKIGDVIIPDSAERGEGTSYYYRPGKKFPPIDVFSRSSKLEDSSAHEASQTALPSEDLKKLLVENAAEEDIAVHVGKIYTTDCYNMETKPFLDELHERGYLGIEMELSALFTVADWHDKEAAGIVVVTDRPYPEYPTFVFHKPQIACENLQKAIRIATKSLLMAE